MHKEIVYFDFENLKSKEELINYIKKLNRRLEQGGYNCTQREDIILKRMMLEEKIVSRDVMKDLKSLFKKQL